MGRDEIDQCGKLAAGRSTLAYEREKALNYRIKVYPGPGLRGDNLV